MSKPNNSDSPTNNSSTDSDQSVHDDEKNQSQSPPSSQDTISTVFTPPLPITTASQRVNARSIGNDGNTNHSSASRRGGHSSSVSSRGGNGGGVGQRPARCFGTGRGGGRGIGIPRRGRGVGVRFNGRRFGCAANGGRGAVNANMENRHRFNVTISNPSGQRKSSAPRQKQANGYQSYHGTGYSSAPKGPYPPTKTTTKTSPTNKTTNPLSMTSDGTSRHGGNVRCRDLLAVRTPDGDSNSNQHSNRRNFIPLECKGNDDTVSVADTTTSSNIVPVFHESNDAHVQRLESLLSSLHDGKISSLVRR